MSGWELTAGLQNLRNQVNAAFPDRDKTSDGTISDAAHRAESRTGHSPDDTRGSNPEWDGDPDSTPEVRAWDMDSDLRSPGVTAQQLVDHIRSLPGVSAVLRYIIFDRKIYRASNGWKPDPYFGASAHTEHVHFSGAWSQAADNNTTFDYRLEDLVALTAAELAKLLNDSTVRAALANGVWNTDNVVAAPGNPKPGKNPDGTPVNTHWTAANYMQNTYNATVSARGYAADARALAGKDNADEAAIAAAVLAGLDPAKIAAAIPADLARQVADELAARLAA